MANEEFEGRDLANAVFWGVSLKGALFRDADFSDSRIFHGILSRVEIDGLIDRFVINGVDVTDYVNQRDRWYPLRNQLESVDGDGLRKAWGEISNRWEMLLASVDKSPDLFSLTVNGEWSLIQTLRHLIFAMDKWFDLPILGKTEFNAIGIPNTGSRDYRWPGLDISATPTVDEVLRVRAAKSAKFGSYLNAIDVADFPPNAFIEENGEVPTIRCFHVVLEEEFEHLRYMVRDIATHGISI